MGNHEYNPQGNKLNIGQVLIILFRKKRCKFLKVQHGDHDRYYKHKCEQRCMCACVCVCLRVNTTCALFWNVFCACESCLKLFMRLISVHKCNKPVQKDHCLVANLICDRFRSSLCAHHWFSYFYTIVWRMNGRVVVCAYVYMFLCMFVCVLEWFLRRRREVSDILCKTDDFSSSLPV